LKLLLEFDERPTKLLEILPSVDIGIDESSGRPECLHVGLEDLVYQTFLALKIVIKLAFAGRRSFDDLVGAGSANALFVK
jgi:hypothetical protein